MTPAGSSASPTGLVAAYSFDEGTGSTVADSSGNGNNGTVTDGTWTTGVHGGALSFNGTSSVVTIPDSSSLDLSNAMTLEAWVERTALSQSWSDVIYKGVDNYYLEASSTDASGAPVGGFINGGTNEAHAPSQLAPATWTHLAVTYDGSIVRLYVNGAQVANTVASGPLQTSGNALQIGGDTVFNQYFTGAIDDVRVYDTALSAAQIQSDMNTPVGGAASSTFTVTPGTAELTTGQSVQFTATTGVTWSVDGVAGGNASVGTITSSGSYTAPASAGSHTITATSGSQTATSTVYVSSHPGTFTFHNDNLRTGANTNETVLTPSNVKASSFGKLFSYPLDGLAFASPLYVKGVNIGGTLHNVVYVATEHDSVYALDADGRSNAPLWKDSFIDSANGIDPLDPAATGESADIPNEIGITGTPVIDTATNTMYFVTADQNSSGTSTVYENWLHAVDIRTGAQLSRVLIDPSVAGSGVDASGGMIPFNNQTENQRSALTLDHGTLYVAFGNHGFNPPYHGWLLAYNPADLSTPEWIFNTSPDAQSGGIWMGGDGVAADSSGQLFFSTGNGTFDAGSGGRDYGDTLLKVDHTNGSVLDYFTPFDYANLDTHDIDLASGGVVLLPDQPGAHPHEALAAGKGGTIYVVDRDNMGHVGSGNDNQIVQSLVDVFPTCCSFNTGNYSSPVYFNGSVYYAAVSSKLMQFSLTNGLLSTSPTSESPETYLGQTGTFDARGGAISASANGNADGILWGLQSSGDSLPGTLHAYNPANLADEYYNSDESGNRDQLNPWLKFTVPTVDNGRVYVISASRLTAYGLLPGVATSSASSGGGGGTGGGGGGTGGGGGGTGGGGGGGGGGGVPPDLKVTLTASSTTAPPVGSALNYSVAVTVGNVGSASDVILKLTLPAGYSVNTTYADRGPGCKGTAPTLTCDVAWISPGVTSHVLVSGAVGQAGEQDATATVTSVVEPVLDPGDDTVTLKLAAPPAPTPTPTPTPTPHPIVLAVKKAPALHGTATPGHLLRAVAPVWSTTPQRVRFSWQLCVRNRCTTIPKATGMALLVRKAWVGKRVRFVAVGVRGTKSVTSRSPLVLVRK